jgi:hypothetical protein
MFCETISAQKRQRVYASNSVFPVNLQRIRKTNQTNLDVFRANKKIYKIEIFRRISIQKEGTLSTLRSTPKRDQETAADGGTSTRGP